jgi:2-isopropylmalate synthase
MKEDKVVIFDTTLRDGEQAAGAAMTKDEKLEIAKELDELGVDVIEAGFPISSPGDFEAVQAIAQDIRRPVICALAHANNAAVDRAWEAIKGAAHPRIHVFLSSSDIHLMHQLRKNREEVMDIAINNVARARRYCDDVEFSPMDATRTDPEYLYVLLSAAIEAGATTINIPDTVGYTISEEFSRLLDGIHKNVRGMDSVTLSVHCHNDLGQASANSLIAILHGARQVEGCINGLGERAGNAATEEIIMALDTRKDLFKRPTNVDTSRIYRLSRLVSDITGFPVQPNKAIVGGNAFRHASGIHQDGMIKDRRTYEIMKPESIGIPGSAIVLGKLSGRHGLLARLNEMGYQPSDSDLNRIYTAFKELADKKREVMDKDLEALMNNQRRAFTEPYKLEFAHITSGTNQTPTATVKISSPKGDITNVSTGTGSVDAMCKAINNAFQVPNKLTDFRINAITEGIDAVAEVTVRVESEGKIYTGRGTDMDTILAAAKAYVNALNRVASMEGAVTRQILGS